MWQVQSIKRRLISPYASIRRSRRNGQCVRYSLTWSQSISAVTISSRSTEPLATISPSGLKSEVPGCEIKFLVIQRIIGHVHLAIFAEQFSIRVDNRRSVVINPGAASLEQRRNNDRAGFSRHISERRCGFSRHSFSQCKILVIFRLTKILRAKEFR